MKLNKLASVLLVMSLLLPNRYALAADTTATTIAAKPDRQPINDSQTATSQTTVDPAVNLQPESTNTATEPTSGKIKVDEAPFRVDAPGGSISTLSGSVNLSYTDLTLVGRNGLNFDLTRTYNSSNSMLVYQHDDYPYHTWEKLGDGWKFEFSHLQFDSWDYNSTGTIYLASKGSFDFDKYLLQETSYLGDVTFANNPTQTDGGDWASFTLKYNDTGKTDYFDQYGNILQTSDSYGNFIRFVYDDKKLSVTKVYNNIGNSIIFTYESGKVIATMGDQTVTYKTTNNTIAPNATAINLAQVIDPAGRVTTYDYAIKQGTIEFGCYCNQIYWILTGINHPTGAKTLYTWEQDSVLRNSQVKVFRIASVEQQIKYTDGTFETFNHINVTYNGDMLVVPSSEMLYPNLPRGVTKYDFSTTLDNGRSQTTYKYLFYNLYVDIRYYNTSITQTNGVTSTTTDLKYDNFRLYASPTATTTTVLQTGKPSYSTWSTKTYDSYANPLTENYEVGGNKVYTYDSNPTRLSSVQESIDSTNTRTTKFQYSTLYKPTSKLVLNSAGQVLASESYTYDAYGNQTEISTTDGTRNIQKKVEYGSAYNYAFPTKTSSQVTDANGTVSTVSNTFEYNPVLGTTTKTTNGNGGVTTYAYDLLGRTVKETYPDLSSKSVKYDDVRNRIELTDELGQKSFSSFNSLGLVMEKGLILQGIDTPKEKHHYDNLGRQDWSQDALQIRTSYAYDAFDRPISTTFADGSVRTVSYDDSANTVTKTDEDGLSVRETLDKKKRTIKTEQLLATGPVTLSVNTYDNQDHVLTAQDANQKTTSYSYDLLGNLTNVTDPEGKTTSYFYNKLGQMTQTLYPDTKSSNIEYDELGRTIKKTDPLGQLETFFYDANNNVTKKVDRTQQQLSFTYDKRNRLLDKSVGTNKIAYQYDLLGRRTNMTVGSDVTSYAYNIEGQLQKETLPDSRYITYTYNANGARTQMRDPFGKVIFYTLDNKSRLTSLSTDTATTTPEVRYTYSKTGLTQSLTQRNGISTELAYDPSANLQSLKVKQPAGTVDKSYTFTYDKNHNQLTRVTNGQSDSFSYDPLNRIKTSSAGNEAYSYDARGNRQTVQSDKLSELNLNTYEYDVWNQLSKVTTMDGKVVTYRYDGDGLLTERTENGTTTRYYYDGDQMIAEASVANGVATLTARYLRGSDSILVAREDATGKKAYYTHNGHGDVTELRDDKGNILNSYQYDIWGKPTITQGQLSNPFLYSGEYWDGTASLQYLRARWYDPAQGRFINEDVIEGQVNSPLTQNLYSYVHNNPITNSDPTGHWCESNGWAHFGRCADGSPGSADAGHTKADLRANGKSVTKVFILIHGINTQGENNMDPLGDALSAYGPSFSVNEYGGGILSGLGEVIYQKANDDSTKTDILVNMINKQKEWWGSTDLDLIAHSGGGVIAINAAARLADTNPGAINHIITIGGANKGKSDYTPTLVLAGYDQNHVYDPVPLINLSSVERWFPATNYSGSYKLGPHTSYFTGGNLNILLGEISNFL